MRGRKWRRLGAQAVPGEDLDSTAKSDFSSVLAVNEAALRHFLAQCNDVEYRRIQTGAATILIVYLTSMVDVAKLDHFLLTPLISASSRSEVPEVLFRSELPVSSMKAIDRLQELVVEVLGGQTAILVDGLETAWVADVKLVVRRAIEEPASEGVVRGPHEGFTETLEVNIGLLRKRVKTENFKLESFRIGKLTQTEVRMGYIAGIAQADIVSEVRHRLASVRLDSVIDAHYIEEMIEDAPFSPYPQVQYTERPDVAVSSLVEGKVVILVDTSPSCLIVPMTFWTGLQAAEDYYERVVYATPVRLLRFVLMNVSIFITPLYVALVTFTPQLLPTVLLLNIAAAREPSPFPTLIEALMMEFLFEGLREAGVRLPRAIGSAVSIVGGLVLGQAAVDAGLISAPIVIMVATGGIASFAIPRYNVGYSLRLIRFPILLMAGLLGLFGIASSFLILLIHQVNLTSFGVPYLSPLSPESKTGIMDFLVRLPRWKFTARNQFVSRQQATNALPDGQRPDPDKS